MDGSALDWFSAAQPMLGSALSPKAAGPSSADSIFGTNLAFDNSGWNVTFGQNSGISAQTDKTNSQGGTSGAVPSLQAYLPYAVLFVGALIAMKAFKK